MDDIRTGNGMDDIRTWNGMDDIRARRLVTSSEKYNKRISFVKKIYFKNTKTNYPCEESPYNVNGYRLGNFLYHPYNF